MFILSWMCQFHWDCGFDDQKFAVNNRHCFFFSIMVTFLGTMKKSLFFCTSGLVCPFKPIWDLFFVLGVHSDSYKSELAHDPQIKAKFKSSFSFTRGSQNQVHTRNAHCMNILKQILIEMKLRCFLVRWTISKSTLRMYNDSRITFDRDFGRSLWLNTISWNSWLLHHNSELEIYPDFFAYRALIFQKGSVNKIHPIFIT